MRKITAGKAERLDRCVTECLTTGGASAREYLKKTVERQLLSG